MTLLWVLLCEVYGFIVTLLMGIIVRSIWVYCDTSYGYYCAKDMGLL